MLQVPPAKFVIFVCDCILSLMDKALAQASSQEAIKNEPLREPGSDNTRPRFDKWIDSPRSQDRYSPCQRKLQARSALPSINLSSM